MEHLSIDASPKQLAKLRKGEKVRVKKGTGFNLLVHPQTLHRVSRTFNRGKGSELVLSKEEIDANMAVSPEQHQQLREINPVGKGIFGRKFDKAASKVIGAERYGKLYKAADSIKPMFKQGIKAGIAAGATAATPALAAYAPALVPFIPAATAYSQYLADDYIDNPDSYQKSFRTGTKGKKSKDIQEKAKQVMMDEQLNHRLGTNYGYMGRAGMQDALAGTIQQKLTDDQIRARLQLAPRNMSSGPKYGQMEDVEYLRSPEPFYGPSSYDRSRQMFGSGIHRDSGEVGLKGGMISEYTPQAMQSQPYGSNFQMQHFLPPQYKQYNSGTTHEGMIGTGMNQHTDHIMAHLPPALQSQPMGANFMMKNCLPVGYSDAYNMNPIVIGKGLGVGLYVGRGLYA